MKLGMVDTPTEEKIEMSEEVDSLRALDAEVHVRVMGLPFESTLVGDGETIETAWHLEPANAAWRVKSANDAYWHRWSPSGAERIVIAPHYSTDIAAAMDVIAWLCPTTEEYSAGRKSCRFIIRQQDSGMWSIEARSPFLTSYDTPAFADRKSLPEAICRAALALVDGNQEKK